MLYGKVISIKKDFVTMQLIDNSNNRRYVGYLKRCKDIDEKWKDFLKIGAVLKNIKTKGGDTMIDPKSKVELLKIEDKELSQDEIDKQKVSDDFVSSLKAFKPRFGNSTDILAADLLKRIAKEPDDIDLKKKFLFLLKK